jgi:hypothetical protein
MLIVFLLVVLLLIGFAAHVASRAIYASLVRSGYAHAKVIRVVSFIAIFVGASTIMLFVLATAFRFVR